MLFDWLRSLFGRRKKIFLSSDLHLDHKNIIRYCHRPFRDVHEMNYWLIRNWNQTVGKNDVVYFLGDLAFSKKRGRVINLLHSLNGKKIIIRGNHDRFLRGHHHYVLKYQGKYFYLVHNPAHIPKTWNSWVIFGHTHHKGQLIDKKHKWINVSTELTDYKPISIDEIIRMVE